MQTPQLVDIVDNVFNKVDTTACIVYVPKGSFDAYSNAAVWSAFANIVEDVPTATNAIDASEFAVYTSERSIVVKGAVSGETVAVYTVSGVLVKAVRADGEVRIPVASFASGGVYVVRVGGKAFKVAI